MNLKRWAEQQGVSCPAAPRWSKTGQLPIPARRVGRLILGEAQPDRDDGGGRAAVDARVSSADQAAAGGPPRSMTIYDPTKREGV